MRWGSAGCSFSRCFRSCSKRSARFSSGRSAMRLASSVSVISRISVSGAWKSGVLQLAQQSGQEVGIGLFQLALDDGFRKIGHRLVLEQDAQGELDAEG